MCAGNPEAGERKFRRKIHLACLVSFILHPSRLSFSDLPLEGAKPPAVPVLQGSLSFLILPFGLRCGVPGESSGQSQTREDSSSNPETGYPPDFLDRVATVRALHFRSGISETAVRVFHL